VSPVPLWSVGATEVKVPGHPLTRFIKAAGWILVMFLVFAPLAIDLRPLFGKNVGIALLDVLATVAAATFFLVRLPFGVPRLEFELVSVAVAAVLVHLTIALLAMVERGSTFPILSFASYVKPFLGLFLGIAFARALKPDRFLSYAAFSIALIAAGLLMSQFLLEFRPFPRWGARLYGANVYGFPNAAASYYVVLLAVLAAAGQSWKRRRPHVARAISGVGIVLCLFMVFSLSRTATVVMSLFLSAWVMLRWQRIGTAALLLLFMAGGGVVASYAFEDQVKPFADAIEARYDRTFKSGDPFSHRDLIAVKTIEYLEDHPVLGSRFGDFSEIGTGFSSAHNQYLEAFHKAGLIGALAYYGALLALVVTLVRVVRRCTRASDDSLRNLGRWALCAISILLVANLTQSNFTYSQTGGVMFFLIGYVVAAFVAARKAAPSPLDAAVALPGPVAAPVRERR
jgi:O-antigen ligase